MEIVLIHPPVSKPCEPPAGLARLTGTLKGHGRQCLVIDANIEGLLSLLNGKETSNDTWTKRAIHHREENITSLKNGNAFKSMGRYTRSVTDLNRILQVAAEKYGTHLSLNNFIHGTLSQVKSDDLIKAAEHPEANVFYPYFDQRLRTMLEEHAPRVVGFSLNYLSQALSTFAMIGHMRSLNPAMNVILGGGLVTSWMRRPGWVNPFSGLVDELVAGPGEEYILSLAGVRNSGRTKMPEYETFWGNGYLSPGRVAPYSTSTGCYWGKCSFCPEKAEGSRYTRLPEKTMSSDLKAMLEKETPMLIHMCDNALSPALMSVIAAQEIVSPWYGFARITHHLADPDFCSALKRSGCVMLKLGLESGDQAVLDELNKGIRLDVARMALTALHDAGIATYVYLLFGTPPEDWDSARRTLSFVAEYNDHIDFLNISIFNLPRGSREINTLATYDFSEGDLSLYQGFVHPKGWDRNRVRQFLDKELKRHPLISPIIRRDPPVFTSNHAPFFVMRGITSKG